MCALEEVFLKKKKRRMCACGRWRMVKRKKYIVILIIKEDVYGWCLVVNIYISYQYYYTNDECKLISSIKFN